ncbi:MAG: leucine-rich repeat protein [Lachnospiraceae bacterium]|nr:leucine-rich repeat protein [Lachnospiraceae bacterium]
MKQQKFTHKMYLILVGLLMTLSLVSINGITANADPGPKNVTVTLKGNTLADSLGKKDVLIAGTTVNFELYTESYEGGNYDSDGSGGIISDNPKVAVDNVKKTITVAKDATGTVNFAYAIKKYDVEKGTYTDEWVKWGEYGPYSNSFTILKDDDICKSVFASNLSITCSQGLVAGGTADINTLWDKSGVSAEPVDLKFTSSNADVTISGNKITVKDSMTADSSVGITVSGKLCGKDVSTTTYLGVYAKYKLCSEKDGVVLKLGNKATLKPYFMERTATASGVSEKKSALKSSETVTYKTDNKNVATVSKKGVIKAAVNKTGTAIITYSVKRNKKNYVAECYACVVEGGTAVKADVKKPATNGKKITIATWNDEIKNRIDFVLKKYPEYKNLIDYIIIPSTDNGYRDYLKKTENESNKPDIVLAEYDYLSDIYALNYVKPVSEIGYNENWYANAYPYTKSRGSHNGKLYALTWQTCPNAFIYQKSAAEKAWGTSDPDKVQEKLKDVNSFISAAGEVKAKGSNIMAVNELYSEILKGMNTNLSSGDTVYFGGDVENAINASMKLADGRYVTDEDRWGDVWNESMHDGKTLGMFGGVPWFAQFCMGNYDGIYDKTYGICEGPVDSYWGGSLLIPTNAGNNNELVTFILYELTADSDMMLDIAVESGDLPNNSVAFKQYAATIGADNPLKKYFINDPFAVYEKVLNNIPAIESSPYQLRVSDGMQNAFREYYNGHLKTLDDMKDYIQKYIQEIYPNVKVDKKGMGAKAKTYTVNIDAGNLKKGDIVLTKDKKGIYTVAKISKDNKITVSYNGPMKSSLTKVSVPDTVKLTTSGDKVNVTRISASAFKGNKKLKKITIGKNVTSIGKNAFNGAGKLANVNIKSKNIKSVGSNAFKNIKSNAKVKVPSSKVKSYSKLFKKAKLPSGAKVSK